VILQSQKNRLPIRPVKLREVDKMSRILPYGLVIACLLYSSSARADRWSLQGLINAQIAATDNLFSVPSDSPDALPKEADALLQLRPGGVLSFATPRSVQEAFADLDVIGYAAHTDAWSASVRGGWRSFVQVGPRTELNTSVGAGNGTLNTLVARSNTPGATLLPSGANKFVSADASQQLAHQASVDVRIAQHTNVQFVRNTDGTTERDSDSLDAGFGGGFDRSWLSNAAAFDLTGSYSKFDRPDLSGEKNKQVSVRATAQWRHDISRQWTSVVDGGAVAVAPLSTKQQTVLVPIVGAQFAYAPQWGNAGFSIRRSVAPNLFIGQNTVSEEVGVFANMPLPWLSKSLARPTWSAVGAAGFSRTHIVDTAGGGLSSSYNVFNFDVAMNYALSESSGLSGRYQFVRQSGSLDSMPVIQGYARNTLLFSFVTRYPAQAAGTIPTRNSLRVDRSNNTPIGDEAGARGSRAPEPQ
jgi:hypothetical protein